MRFHPTTWTRGGVIAVAFWCVMVSLSSAPAMAVPVTPWRTAPLGLAATLATRPVDPSLALRGASIVAVTQQPDSSVLVEARTAGGRGFHFTVEPGQWRTVAAQLIVPTVAGQRHAGENEGRGMRRTREEG